MKNYLERFKRFDVHDWVINAFLFLASVLGFYFSIGMSISMSKGISLFDKSGQVTPSDLSVLALVWILTIIVFLSFVFEFFFKKINHEKIIRKEINDGVTIIMEDKRDDTDK